MDQIEPLPPAVPGDGFVLDDPHTGPVHVYASIPGDAGATPSRAPMLLVHSVNAAGSAFEVRPIYEHYGASRPTYALDLPGFGLSDRSDRPYSIRLMTDAVHAVVEEIRRRHGGIKVDTLALSLASEYVARAANEDASAFRTLALVSPTGFNGTTKRTGPPGSSRAIPGMHAILSFGLWGESLYNALTLPRFVRYFLERTWGAKNIDEAMWAYDVKTARQPGAKNAPFYFLSGSLFSNDVNTLYDALTLPVWLSHGVRGDFVDFRGAEDMKDRKNWLVSVFETGAFPQFEVPDAFFAAYDSFLLRG